jgi:hypothetical protein
MVDDDDYALSEAFVKTRDAISLLTFNGSVSVLSQIIADQIVTKIKISKRPEVILGILDEVRESIQDYEISESLKEMEN